MDEPDGTRASVMKDRQLALDVMCRQNLTKTWLYRMDSMRAFIVDADNFNNVHFKILKKL